MFYVKKKLEISGNHRLNLPYESKYFKTHEHNWIITIYCKADKLNENGMVVDFNEIKEKVIQLNHKDINSIVDFNPTAENLARFICELIGNKCYKVKIQENEGNTVIYEI